jgi:hypothetical protein
VVTGAQGAVLALALTLGSIVVASRSTLPFLGAALLLALAETAILTVVAHVGGWMP